MSLASKNQKMVKRLVMRTEANRKCFECGLKSTPYVIMNYGIFVCTFCSGIHRKFQHKVKGISMTNFKNEDVKRLKQMGGNDAAQKRWRAKLNVKKYPLPKPNDELAVSKFIEQTFNKHRWAADDASVEQQETPAKPAEKSTSNIKIGLGRKTSGRKREKPKSKPVKAVKSPPKALVAEPPKQKQTDDFGDPFGDDKWDFGDFDEKPVQKAPEVKKVPKEKPVDDFGDPVGGDDWGFEKQFSGEAKKVEPQPAVQEKKGGNLLDDFFGPIQPTQPSGQGNTQSKPPEREKTLDIDELFKNVQQVPVQQQPVYGMAPRQPFPGQQQPFPGQLFNPVSPPQQHIYRPPPPQQQNMLNMFQSPPKPNPVIQPQTNGLGGFFGPQQNQPVQQFNVPPPQNNVIVSNPFGPPTDITPSNTNNPFFSAPSTNSSSNPFGDVPKEKKESKPDQFSKFVTDDIW